MPTGLCQTANILCSLPFVYSILRYPKLSGIKEYTFWNVFDKYEIKVVSMMETDMGEEVSRQMFSLIPGKFYTEIAVGEGEVALVYYDNVLQRQLTTPGLPIAPQNKAVLLIRKPPRQIR